MYSSGLSEQVGDNTDLTKPTSTLVLQELD